MIMEILSNFISIYCLITFIVGAVFMLAMLSIAAMGKDKEPRNKVRFFIRRISIDRFILTILNKEGYCVLSDYVRFQDWNLYKKDFEDLEIGERKELILNLEDWV